MPDKLPNRITRVVAAVRGAVAPKALTVESADAIRIRAREQLDKARAANTDANERLGWSSLRKDETDDNSMSQYHAARETVMAAGFEVAESEAALTAAERQYADLVAAAHAKGVRDRSTAVYGAAQDVAATADAIDELLDSLAARLKEWAEQRERLRVLAPDTNAVDTLIQAQAEFPAVLAVRLRAFPTIKVPPIPDARRERWANYMPDAEIVRDAVVKSSR